MFVILFLYEMYPALLILLGVCAWCRITGGKRLVPIVMVGITGLFLSQNADARGHRHHHRHHHNHHGEPVKHVPLPVVRPPIPGPVDPASQSKIGVDTGKSQLDPILDPSGNPVVLEGLLHFKTTFKEPIKYTEPWTNALGLSPFELIAYAAGQQAWTTDPLEVVLYNLDKRAKYVEAQRQIALAYYLSNPPQKKVHNWKDPIGVIFLLLGIFVIVGTVWYGVHTWGKSD